MAHNPKRSAAAANAACDAMATRLNGGFADVYDGAQPASPAIAITTQTKLARFQLAATAFGAAANGIATANTIAGTVGLAVGTGTWVRLRRSDETAEVDGTVGISTAVANLFDLNVDSDQFAIGEFCVILSLTLTESL